MNRPDSGSSSGSHRWGGWDPTRDVSTHEDVDADAEHRVPHRREPGAIVIVEEEVPDRVRRPPKRQKRGPAPDAEHATQERRTRR